MKRFSPELKKQVIAEAKELGNVAAVARHRSRLPSPKKEDGQFLDTQSILTGR